MSLRLATSLTVTLLFEMPAGCVDPSPDADLGAAVDAGHDPAHDPDAEAVRGATSHGARDLLDAPCNASTWRSLGSDLRVCNLEGEDLTGVSLRRANLSDSNLSRATLRGADLFNCQFVRSNLDGANLDGANLAGADFTGAHLIGASLLGADLSSAVFTLALRSGARTDLRTTCPDGNHGPCW